MKRIYSLLTLALFAIVVSCTDDDLDPLNFSKVTKGKILALRGDALQSIYINGNTYYSSFVPLIADGTETFTYEAEYLSDDPTSLESIDLFVEDADGNRTLLDNVPFSAFTTTGDERPKVSVSYTLAEILPLIGMDATFPLTQDQVDFLLDEYAAGIAIVTDLNLTDGTKVLADEMVAIGLYQSDVFYPAQRLPFGVVEYCPYESDEWGGTFKTLEIADETVGPYNTTLTRVGLTNTYIVSNVLDEGYDIEITFVESTSPYDQEVTVETVTLGAGDKAAEFKAEGSYEQCTGVITLDVTYGKYEFTYQLTKR